MTTPIYYALFNQHNDRLYIHVKGWRSGNTLLIGVKTQPPSRGTPGIINFQLMCNARPGTVVYAYALIPL